MSGRLWVDEWQCVSSEWETGLMSGRVFLVSGRLWVDEWRGVSSAWFPAIWEKKIPELFQDLCSIFQDLSLAQRQHFQQRSYIVIMFSTCFQRHIIIWGKCPMCAE